MAVTAATDPRNEKTCINRVRPGVASWWTVVRTNASNCCVSPSSISSASHPKTTRAVAATRRAPSSKNPLFTFFDLSMSLNLGRFGILPAPSRLVDHIWIPQETRFSECDRPLKVADCAYGYQKENQDEADEVKENCGQEIGADEEGGKEKAGYEEGNSQEEVGEEEGSSEKGGGENKGR